MSAEFTVSVVIPAYNAAATIDRCLAGLAAQSYPPDRYEVIVVDDGSTDDTGVRIKSTGVKYLYQPNQGPATARNNGAAEANGDIILFTDADCIPTANWIAEMVKPFSDPEVIAVKGAYRCKQSGLVARFVQLEFEERFAMLEKAESIDMIDTYAAAIRKNIFADLHGFDTSFPKANNEDTELSYRMAALGKKMVFNPKAIVYHLNHPASIRRYATLKFSRGYWRLVVYKRFPGKMLKDTYTPQTLKLQIVTLFLLVASVVLLFLPILGVPYLTLALAVILIGLMAPFTCKAFVKDPLVGLAAPVLLVIRAGALGLGSLWAITHKSKG